MAEQTAMQKLLTNLESIDIKIPQGIKDIYLQMEKEQILKTSKDSYIAGYIDNQCKVDDSMNFPEEYYNETYNK